MTIPWEPYTADGDGSIPMDRWGKDHWSTLAYAETCCVDRQGIIGNAQMRCNARLHREFANTANGRGLVDGSGYPTRLQDGDLPGHDDWSCLEDMVAAGLMTVVWRRTRPSVLVGGGEARVTLTPLGMQVAAQLRQHKATGGTFHTFIPTLEEAP